MLSSVVVHNGFHAGEETISPKGKAGSLGLTKAVPMTKTNSEAVGKTCRPFSFARYWRFNLILIAVILLIWLLVTFVPVYFARELAGIEVFGWSFSFWMAAFCVPLLYLLLIGIYAGLMNRADRRILENSKDHH